MRYLISISVIIFACSCVLTGYRGGGGAAYFGYATREAADATEAPGPKRGDACAYNVLALVSLGNASIAKAKQNGGISRVATVDHDYSNLLWSFGRYCVVITGE